MLRAFDSKKIIVIGVVVLILWLYKQKPLLVKHRRPPKSCLLLSAMGTTKSTS